VTRYLGEGSGGSLMPTFGRRSGREGEGLEKVILSSPRHYYTRLLRGEGTVTLE